MAKLKHKFTHLLESFYHFYNPFHKLIELMMAGEREAPIDYIHDLKKKKTFFTDTSFNEVVSLAIVRQRDDVAYALLSNFPHANLNKGYQQGWFLKDNLLAVACENHTTYQIISSILKRVNSEHILQKTTKHPNVLLAYLDREMKLHDLMTVSDLIDSGVDLKEKVKIHIGHGQSYFCNALDLAIINEEEHLINLVLEKGIHQGLITPDNIAHSREVYEHKILGLKQAPTNERIDKQLNYALVLWEKNYLSTQSESIEQKNVVMPQKNIKKNKI